MQLNRPTASLSQALCALRPHSLHSPLLPPSPRALPLIIHAPRSVLCALSRSSMHSARAQGEIEELGRAMETKAAEFANKDDLLLFGAAIVEHADDQLKAGLRRDKRKSNQKINAATLLFTRM